MTFWPHGVVAVVPPWNFPVAIPTGGVSAALAAGNAVVFKPSPETPRCAEIVAEACWAAGVPTDVLQFVRTPDDDTGRRLVESADAVIFTGSWETAELFRTWKPELRLFAETSGKNALVVTEQADLDLAAADLVRSAFGHCGQKCSAASLGIVVAGLYDDERFRAKLVDAARSLPIGDPTRPGPALGPLDRRAQRAPPAGAHHARRRASGGCSSRASSTMPGGCGARASRTVSSPGRGSTAPSASGQFSG